MTTRSTYKSQIYNDILNYFSPSLHTMSTHFILHTLQKSHNNLQVLYDHLVSIFLGIICYRLRDMMAYNILHGKIQLLEGNMTKKISLFQSQQLLCLFVKMGTFFLLLQFTLSSFGSLQVRCQDLGISCAVTSAVPLNMLTVLSKREKQIKH